MVLKKYKALKDGTSILRGTTPENNLLSFYIGPKRARDDIPNYQKLYIVDTADYCIPFAECFKQITVNSQQTFWFFCLKNQKVAANSKTVAQIGIAIVCQVVLSLTVLARKCFLFLGRLAALQLSQLFIKPNAGGRAHFLFTAFLS